MGKKENCIICGGKIELRYNPMEEWNIDGVMCGDCYSKKVNDHYPGEHIRVNKHLD